MIQNSALTCANVGEEDDLTCPRKERCRSGVAREALSYYSKYGFGHTCTSTLACFPHHSENQIHDSKENNIASHTSLRAVSRSASTETPTAMLCGRTDQNVVPVHISVYSQACLYVIPDKRLRMIETPYCINVINS